MSKLIEKEWLKQIQHNQNKNKTDLDKAKDEVRELKNKIALYRLAILGFFIGLTLTTLILRWYRD